MPSGTAIRRDRTSRRGGPSATLTAVDNAAIADRLDAFASLLELADANPYTARAYRRAADTIRGAGVPVADLVRSGRVRDLRGIGSGIEARLVEALSREPEPHAQRGLLLNRAWELVGGIAAALGGEVAGDVRRWRDSCELLAVVCAAADPQPVLARFAELPQIVARVSRTA